VVFTIHHPPKQQEKIPELAAWVDLAICPLLKLRGSSLADTFPLVVTDLLVSLHIHKRLIFRGHFLHQPNTDPLTMR
jgi:hypothetical protein